MLLSYCVSIFKIKEILMILIQCMCVCVTVGMEIDAEYDSGSDGKF